MVIVVNNPQCRDNWAVMSVINNPLIVLIDIPNTRIARTGREKLSILQLTNRFLVTDINRFVFVDLIVISFTESYSTNVFSIQHNINIHRENDSEDSVDPVLVKNLSIQPVLLSTSPVFSIMCALRNHCHYLLRR